MVTMTEIATLALAKATAYDGRGRDMSTADKHNAVQAMAEALHPGSTPADVSRAVAEHYANSRAWIMPADINRLTARYRAERLSVTPVPYPDGLGDTPGLETAWRAHYRDAVLQGANSTEADTYAWKSIGQTPPDRQLTGPPADIHTQLEKLKKTFGKAQKR